MTRDRSRPLIVAAGAAWLVTMVIAGLTAAALVSAAEGSVWTVVLGVVAALLILGAAATAIPALRGLREHLAGRTALQEGRVVEARAHLHRARQGAAVTLGSCLPILLLCGAAFFLMTNDRAVQRTFFDYGFMSHSATEVTKAFGRNIAIALIAETLVLVWGLVVAVARMAPGRAGRPIRLLATAYVDAFRAVPAIIVIYLLGFGLPLAGVPVLSDLTPFWAAVLALTLTYGAYVAEVYRAGIESIHWSQTSAARSLGLSHGRTLRHVVVPQAVKRVTPPLLNDFIGLQKDTALVTVIGTVEAFTQAKTYASNTFNLSSVTVVAVLFIIITIPQTRFVDRMLARDQQRLRAQG